jgi:hypothetical protein
LRDRIPALLPLSPTLSPADAGARELQGQRRDPSPAGAGARFAACERVGAATAAASAVGERARREAARASGDFRTQDDAMFEDSFEGLERAIGDYMRQNPRDFPGMG